MRMQRNNVALHAHGKYCSGATLKNRANFLRIWKVKIEVAIERVMTEIRNKVILALLLMEDDEEGETKTEWERWV